MPIPPHIRVAPPLAATPVLDALPEALRKNVLGYAARKVREFDVLLKRSAVQSLPANVQEFIDTLTTMPFPAPETGTIITTASEAQATGNLSERLRGIMTDISQLAALNTGDLLANDKNLLTVLSDLSKHYKSAIPDTLHTEVLEHVLHLKDHSPADFRALSRVNIAPTIGEIASNVVNLTDYRKVAFATVAGVAVGAVMHKVLFPHKDPKDQPQLA